jgi:hypothetical protein
VEVLRLVALARGTLPHEILHNATHVGEMEVSVKPVPGALHAFVSILMDRRDDLLEQR